MCCYLNQNFFYSSFQMANLINIGNWRNICNDAQLFSKIFVTDRFKSVGYTPAMLQSFICTDVLLQINTAQLLSELGKTVLGLPELIFGVSDQMMFYYWL